MALPVCESNSGGRAGRLASACGSSFDPAGAGVLVHSYVEGQCCFDLKQIVAQNIQELKGGAATASCHLSTCTTRWPDICLLLSALPARCNMWQKLVSQLPSIVKPEPMKDLVVSNQIRAEPRAHCPVEFTAVMERATWSN